MGNPCPKRAAGGEHGIDQAEQATTAAALRRGEPAPAHAMQPVGQFIGGLPRGAVCEHLLGHAPQIFDQHKMPRLSQKYMDSQ